MQPADIAWKVPAPRLADNNLKLKAKQSKDSEEKFWIHLSDSQITRIKKERLKT
jgi:hypothetical protein